MTLGIVILALVGLAFVHFILEGILVPSAHMLNRLELLRKARELERVRESEGARFKKETCDALQRSIHNFVNSMPHFNVVAVVRTMLLLQHDPEFRVRSEARQRAIEESPAEAKAIFNRVSRIAQETLSWNTVGWAAYVIPVVTAVTMYKHTGRAVRVLLGMSPKQLEQMDHVNTVYG